MFEEDYIMRIIHEMVRTVLKLLFNIDEKKEEVQISDETMERKRKLLFELADSGKINEAENRLFSELDQKDLNQLQMGLLFFDYINDFSDEALEQAGYTREEIRFGIEALLKEYGYEGLSNMIAM